MAAHDDALPIARWGDAALEQVCRTGIPGYDPWSTAGPGHRFEVPEVLFAKIDDARRIELEGRFAGAA